MDRAYAAALSAIGLTDFDAVMQTDLGVPVSVHKDRSAVRLQVDVDGEPRELYLKRTLYHPAAGVIRDLICGRWPKARPIHECAMCKRLEALGVPAMRAVACGQRQRWLLPHQAFVLVEAVAAQWTLEKAFRERADGTPRLTPSEKRQVIRDLAKTVARLHEAGLRWPDLVSKHVLLQRRTRSESTKPAWNLYLIDVERVARSRSDKLRQRDLLHLLHSMPAGSVSRTDLLRFALAYCGGEGPPRAGRRDAIRRQCAWMMAPNGKAAGRHA